MTGLAVTAGVLTLVVYVALRRAMPVGVAVDPWPYFPTSPRDLFERTLPNPGDPTCGAVPPRWLLRAMSDRSGREHLDPRGFVVYPPAGFRALGYCHLPPHDGHAHIGLAICDGDKFARWQLMSYQWIDASAVHRPRRWRWWRRALIRFSTRLATS